MSKKNIRPQSGKQLYLNQLFLKGMLHTSSEMTEGFVKTLTNFDITPTGDSAIPRKPFNKYTINNEDFLEGDYIYPVQFKQAIKQQHYIKFENTITEEDFVKYDEGMEYIPQSENFSFGIKMFSRNKNINNNTNNVTIFGSGSYFNNTSYDYEYEDFININYYNFEITEYSSSRDIYKITIGDLDIAVDPENPNVYYTLSIPYPIISNLLPYLEKPNDLTLESVEVNWSKITQVPDGDSGYLNNNFPFRLIGIDCPEINEEYHEVGKYILKGLLRTSFDEYSVEENHGIKYVSINQQDRYGRNLIEIYVKRPEFDGKWISVNKLMILLGLAKINYTYSYIYINDYITNFVQSLIALDEVSKYNLKDKDSIDPFYNYAYNIITNNSIKLNNIEHTFKIVAVKLQANSYPSSKVVNTLDEVKFIYNDYLDAVGFIGMLVDQTNTIIYKGVIYVRANATKTFDGTSYNYDNPNFYIYLPDNELNGREVNVIEGSTTGYNLLDKNLIHIEDKERHNEAFSILGLAVIDPNKNETTIVEQAIRGLKVKLNAITNLGYFYNSSTTNTEDYGYTLNYEISNLNNYLPYSDTKFRIQRVIGDSSNYDEAEIKVWNIQKKQATNLKDVSVIWNAIKDNNDNTKIRNELDDNIKINNDNEIVISFDDQTYGTLPNFDNLICNNYAYYYKHIYNTNESIYYAAIISEPEYTTTTVASNTINYVSIKINFISKSIPYIIEDSSIYCYSLTKAQTPAITLKLNSYSIHRKVDNVYETVATKPLNINLYFNNNIQYGDLIGDPNSIIESKYVLKTAYEDSNKEINKFYELGLININNDEFDLTGNILTYKLKIYHNYNNFNRILTYNSSTQEYDSSIRTASNKPTYFFKTWSYNSNNEWIVINKDINKWTYYTTSTSNIVQKNSDNNEDIYWVIDADGNIQIKYTLQPKIRVSEESTSWLHNVFITNDLQEMTAVIPVFKIGATINYINQENIRENIDFKNATRIGIFNRQVFVYGPYTKSNFLQFSMFEKEWYFPFPYYNIEFEEPITWVYNYKNELIVFTKYNILRLSGSSSILECTKTKLYENLTIALSDINMINVVNKYLLFFNNNMGYIMVPNLYTTDALENANIYKLSENILNLENDPEHYIRSRKGITDRYILNNIYNHNPKTYVQSNEIYLVYNYEYNGNYIPVIYIYNTDYKYWRLYDTTYVKSITNNYICEPYLNNQFIAKDTNGNNILLLLDNLDNSSTCKEKTNNVISNNNISCFIESGYLSVDTMNDKRFKDLIIELDRVFDTLTIKCNFYIDGFPVLIEDATALLIDKYNNVNEVTATRVLESKLPQQAISLESFDTQYNDNYFGVIYKLDSNTSAYFLGNRNHFRIPLFGKGRLPSFSLELTSAKVFEFINYSIIYKEKNINRRR